MSDGAAVNSKRYWTGCAGMAICPIPAIWPRSPRPFQILWWLQRRLLYLHALNFNKGGLVTACHNELCGGVADLAIKSFTPSHMCNNPLIFVFFSVQRPKSQPPVTHPIQQKLRQRPQNRRATFWSGTSVRMVLTVLTTCVSLTLTLNHIYRRHPRSVFRRQQGRRKICTWMPVSSNVNFFCPLSPLLMGYWMWRYRLPWKDSHPHHKKLVATLLEDARIRQE